MRILLGGRVSRGEFHEIERDVSVVAERVGADLDTRERINVDSFFNRFVDERYDGPEPTLHSLYDVDFFVLCRSFPNEFNVKDVEALRRVAPLAPIVLIAGELCEGENRTGEVFPGVRRYYVGEWRAEGKREFELFFLEGGAKGAFARSPLESTVDLLTNAVVEPLPKIQGDGCALVLTDDSAMGETLKDAFASAGYEPRVESLVRFSDANSYGDKFTRVVVDCVNLADPYFPYKLATIKSKFLGVPIDLLAFAPKSDERAFFERRDLWGRLRVIAKPFDVDFLVNGAR